MQSKGFFFFFLLFILLLIPQWSWAVEDMRMQVDVFADAEKGPSLSDLHTNISHAADLALPVLWDRIIPDAARHSVAGKAIHFFQRATPTATGVSIIFNRKRVLDYLQSKAIPYIANAPNWELVIELVNKSGISMPQSEMLLHEYAVAQADPLGYRLDNMNSSLILQWRWLDQRQVMLTVRGTSQLAEFSELRTLGAGDPLLELQQWLVEILRKARDSYAQIGSGATGSTAAIDAVSMIPLAAPQQGYLLLSIERKASLPEQVVFEDDLRHDPRIVDLSPRQLSKDMQQYSLRLKGADDQWLADWFKQRGLTLTPTLEGWVAR